MATLGSALIYVRAVTDKLKGDLTSAERDVDGSAKKMGSSISAIPWAKVAATATAAFGLVAVAMNKAVKAANEQELAEAKLTAVIKASGNAAGFTANQMFDMATEMQRTTKYGDELNISSMAVLASFKNIAGDAFPRTMKAAADMATVMGTDLQSAIVMIGKAMNDPIANLSAMSRAGVQFTVDQKAMVKELWLAGDMMGAQTIILKELESQFGGAAVAARDTFGGAMIGVSGVIGDLWEEIGFTITKNKDFIKGLQDLEKVIIEATPAVGKFFKNAIYLAQDVSWAVGVVAKDTKSWYDFLIGDALKTTERMGEATGDWIVAQMGVNTEILKNKDALAIARKEGTDFYDGMKQDANAFDQNMKGVNVKITTYAKDAAAESEIAWGIAAAEIAKTWDEERRDADGLNRYLEEENQKMVDELALQWEEGYKTIDQFTQDGLDDFIAEWDEGYKTLDTLTEQELKDFTAEWDEGFKDVEENKDGMVAGFKAGMEDIVGHAGTMADATKGLVTDMRDGMSGVISDMVDQMVDGTITLESLGEAMAGMLENSFKRFASRMLDKVLDTIIEVIAANVAAGASAAGGRAAGWGGVTAAAAEVSLYLAGATAAITGARTVAETFAEGGWLGENPCGGMINCGSGVADDVFLGTTPGVNHWGMGGEFVVNKKSTAKYRPILEKINRGYGDGGDVSGYIPWKSVADMLAFGSLASAGYGFASGGPMGALGAMATFLGSTIAGSFAGKAANYAANKTGLWAGGGPIPGYANQGHFNVPGIKDDWLKPGKGKPGFDDLFPGGNVPGIPDDWFNIPTNPDEAWDQLKDMGKDVWNNIKDCVSDIIDWDDLGEWLLKMVRQPLKQVSKDMVAPGVYHPDGLKVIEDILGGGWKLIKEFIKEFVPSPKDILGCFETGTNYVPRDGAYYLHQGEAVVPARENSAGPRINISFVNKGIITTNDVDAWFAERFERVQSRRMGIQYQAIKMDQVGLAL